MDLFLIITLSASFRLAFAEPRTASTRPDTTKSKGRLLYWNIPWYTSYPHFSILKTQARILFLGVLNFIEQLEMFLEI